MEKLTYLTLAITFGIVIIAVIVERLKNPKTRITTACLLMALPSVLVLVQSVKI